MVEPGDRLPPPPFWRTRYFAFDVIGRPDRREIDMDDIRRALSHPDHRLRQPDGRSRHWVWVESHHRWLRIVIEPDGETVHNAFWDRGFKP